MLSFCETHFVAIYLTILAFFGGVFLGGEITMMNMEKPFRQLYESKVADSNKMERCLKQVARINND